MGDGTDRRDGTGGCDPDFSNRRDNAREGPSPKRRLKGGAQRKPAVIRCGGAYVPFATDGKWDECPKPSQTVTAPYCLKSCRSTTRCPHPPEHRLLTFCPTPCHLSPLTRSDPQSYLISCLAYLDLIPRFPGRARFGSLLFYLLSQLEITPHNRRGGVLKQHEPVLLFGRRYSRPLHFNPPPSTSAHEFGDSRTRP